MDEEMRTWIECNANVRGGLFLLDAEKAICLIDKLTDKKIPISGVDAIFVEENATTPSSDLSIDVENLPKTRDVQMKWRLI